MTASALSLRSDGAWLGCRRAKVYPFPDMRRCLSRIFSLLVALALVVNGVPTTAMVLPVSASETQDQSGSGSGLMDDMPVEDCCNSCVPTSGSDRACFATCVHLPAVVAVALLTQAVRTPAFEPAPLNAVHGRPIAPDPLPPRPRI